jgi:hypothetical protein
LDNLGQFEQFGTMWDNLGQFGTIWDNLGQFETIWDNVGQIETFWDTMGQVTYRYITEPTRKSGNCLEKRFRLRFRR